ncbi:hypothetical protein SUGI_1489560 [Cryptomeria japonica]|uniref:Uncharacterized protein n=1 Tax=Cryptomeria japonica TaxID=3369 RepID=A0AAD3NTA6_CRYJA|nr:hypothetical protein SUGI_1489560 [Cryptomeria japonica]
MMSRRANALSFRWGFLPISLRAVMHRVRSRLPPNNAPYGLKTPPAGRPQPIFGEWRRPRDSGHGPHSIERGTGQRPSQPRTLVDPPPLSASTGDHPSFDYNALAWSSPIRVSHDCDRSVSCLCAVSPNPTPTGAVGKGLVEISHAALCRLCKVSARSEKPRRALPFIITPLISVRSEPAAWRNRLEGTLLAIDLEDMKLGKVKLLLVQLDHSQHRQPQQNQQHELALPYPSLRFSAGGSETGESVTGSG